LTVKYVIERSTSLAFLKSVESTRQLKKDLIELLRGEMILQDISKVLLILYDTILDDFLSPLKLKRLSFLALRDVGINLILDLLLNGCILSRKLDSDNGAKGREDLNEFLFLQVDRNVGDDDCTIIKLFISQLFAAFELELLILNPVVLESLLD
jgi:hypothetical protein